MKAGTRVDFRPGRVGGHRTATDSELVNSLRFVRAPMQSSPTTSVSQQLADLKVSYMHSRAQTSTY